MHATHKRSRSHASRNLAIAASALISSASLAAATAPAHAADSGALSGRAYGIGLSNITLLGSTLAPAGATPDTGVVQTDRTSTTTAPCGSDPGPYITATLLCPVVSTDADTWSVHSAATAATAHIGLPGLPVIDVTGVKAVADASCLTRPSASTTIDYLKVGPTVVIAQRTVVKPNTVINVGAVKLILNEQSLSGPDVTSSTVNAIHVKTGLISLVTADVVVSSAQATVACGSPLD